MLGEMLKHTTERRWNAGDRYYPYTFVNSFEPKSSVLSQDLTFVQGYPREENWITWGGTLKFMQVLNLPKVYFLMYMKSHFI